MPWTAVLRILDVRSAGEVEIVPQNGNGLQDAGAPELDHASELFARYSGGVYRYCLRRLGSREEAEDALQVTYLNAWRSLKGGFQPNQHQPWLYQIAANVCSTSLRSKLRGKQVELRDPAALDALVAQERIGAEELVGLSEALRDLPARQRRALVLRDWQGLSYREIARELAVSVASVETLLFRGRNRIAAALSNADWKKAASSARALFIWPVVALRTKSAATAGAEQVKIGLVAGGAVAPLIAFGLIQGFLPGQRNQPPEPVRTSPVGQVKGVQTSGSAADEGIRVHRPFSQAGTHAAAAHRPSGDRKHAAPAANGGDRPEPTTDTPAKAGPAAAPTPDAKKIVVCHSTQSKKNPGVTISVSVHAKGHQDDTPGTC
jgi:RNA polymerase sigma-70 factor, ECF subfamily